MKEPVWVSEELAIKIHDYQLAEHGGLPGLRTPDGLASALDRPRNRFFYGISDIIDLAANYAYGISSNHPFSDANKRSALVICRTFLKLNGYNMVATREEKYQIMYDLASGAMSEDDFSVWLRAHVVKLEGGR